MRLSLEGGGQGRAMRGSGNTASCPVCGWRVIFGGLAVGGSQDPGAGHGGAVAGEAAG